MRDLKFFYQVLFLVTRVAASDFLFIVIEGKLS